MKKIAFVISLLVIALMSCSCGAQNQNQKEKTEVVATLFPQYDFVREIAKDRVELSLLLPLGADSHSFDPSMQDMIKIKNADLFIYTGKGMESWTSGFLGSLNSDCTVLDLSDCVTLICPDEAHEHEHDEHEEHEHDENTADPHIWTSPKNAIKIVDAICSSLCDIDKENAEFYKANAREYIEKLEKLDADITSVVQGVTNKKLYFGGKFSFLYFCKAYGLDYISLYDSCSDNAEPSAKRLTDMVNEIKANSIKVILFPELTEPKAARTIAERTGASVQQFHSCHNLSKSEFSEGRTYYSIMLDNLEVLKEALS